MTPFGRGPVRDDIGRQICVAVYAGRVPSYQQLPGEDTEGEDVTREAVRRGRPAPSKNQLRRQIRNRSNDAANRGEPLRVSGERRDPEVHQLDVTEGVRCSPERIGEEDVRGFEIPVNDTAAVHVRERRGELPEHRDTVLRPEAWIAEQHGQRLPAHEIEHQPEPPTGQREDVATRNDAGVISGSPHGLGFAPGPLGGRRGQSAELEQLERDHDAATRIDDLPHRALTAHPERLDQRVAIDLDPRA